MNDRERADWVNNDEGLYNWWKGSRQPLRAFVRENRAEIDGAVGRVTGGDRPAHYLAYGPDAGRYPSRATNRYGQSLTGRAGQSLIP